MNIFKFLKNYLRTSAGQVEAKQNAVSEPDNHNTVTENMQGVSSRDFVINRCCTPDFITQVGRKEIFVFGSNLQGYHAGGAARIAHKQFGAIWRCGVGLQGNTYTIPTMQGGIETIQPYVDNFIEFAKSQPDLIFYVTKIGCGIAGFKVEEIAPLFSMALKIPNIRLPKEFHNIIQSGLSAN